MLKFIFFQKKFCGFQNIYIFTSIISNQYLNQEKPENPLKSRDKIKILLMKNLEKLEDFQLQNEQLQAVVGQGGPLEPSFELGYVTTGAGQEQLNDWPAPGQTTCINYTSDMWDGSDHRTMKRFGETYS